MGVLTSIGEVGIELEGRAYKLRPSFFAISQLGDPAEIVQTFALLHGAPALTGVVWEDRRRLRAFARDRLRAAIGVLWACSEEDISHLTGSISERMNYRPGAMPFDDVVVIARALLKHGISGDVKLDEQPAGSGEYSGEFKARDYVASAMAHLGATEADAWAMTMTSYLAAMRAKYPPVDPKTGKVVPARNAPTSAQHDAAMDWLAQVNAERAKRAKK